MKSRATKRELNALRSRMFKLFDLVPESGCYVPWMGLKLKVGPSVFWPHEDSMPLALNYEIRKGEEVLDVCTGSGNLAILSGLKGAGRVLGIDRNPVAVKVARENVKAYQLENKVKIIQKFIDPQFKELGKFDVVTGNLPFTKKNSRNRTEATMYDSGLSAHYYFFASLDGHLKPNGRCYLAHSDIGALDEMLEIADSRGFSVKKIGQYTTKKPHIVFSAFELRRKR